MVLEFTGIKGGINLKASVSIGVGFFPCLIMNLL
jgi:hypothetical protein